MTEHNVSSLQAAHDLLTRLTEKYPPTTGKHSLVLHKGCLLLTLRTVSARTDSSAWYLEQRDLKKPVDVLFEDICTLVEARMDEHNG